MNSIESNGLYNHNTLPDKNINPSKIGALWNSNDSKQIQCCVNNSLNANIWTRLNPDLPKFDLNLDDIENKLNKPEYKPPINGYKSQIIARYLAIDGDDGNGTRISFGNKRITLCPHFYGSWSGGDEYGAVALMVRDIGYLGTVGRGMTTIGVDTVPRSLKVGDLNLRLSRGSEWNSSFEITGGQLPLWPKSSNFAIGKLKFYFFHPNMDSRISPYWKFGYGYTMNHDYYDLMTCIPFPYDNYGRCRVREAGIPTTQIDGWRAVSKAEWDACLDTRKKVSETSNTYLIPIVSPNNLPYNARDDGIDALLEMGNGLHVTFADVYYDGDIDAPN